jgi:diacylglycerol kinase (ATP)
MIGKGIPISQSRPPRIMVKTSELLLAEQRTWLYPGSPDTCHDERMTGMHAIFAAFLNSLRGLGSAARSERSVRQELFALAAALPASALLSSDLWVRVALVGTILLTLAVELLNTALERLCDHVTPQRHPAIGAVKDMGSAAVLCMLALSALVWAAALFQALVS